MDFERIHPYVRFTAMQTLVHSSDWSSSTVPLIGLDNRMYYCTRGVGCVTVDGVQYELTPGSMLLWRAGLPYSYTATSGHFTCITCNFDYFPRRNNLTIPAAPVPQTFFHPELLLEDPFLFTENYAAFNTTVFLKNAMFLDDDINDLLAAYEYRFHHYSLQCTLSLTQALMKILQNLESCDPVQQNTLVREISHYIHMHYAEPLSNESIGKQFGYHAVYINSLFKKYTNTSLHQYVINTRLHRAMHLLMETDHSIEEIAMAVGFSNAPYFSRLFKMHFQISPAHFRTKSLNNTEP